ncbi:MAG: NFACT family protein [Erysipelotrichaceae bacterium]|nr:NFACT family protein [Erysipelotrichaceae bacterium]
MALDGIILSKVKEDLDTCLPIKINRISETSKTEILFNVLAGGSRRNLVMSFHSVYNHICFSDRNYATFAEPGTFVMVLRKYLIGGIIYAIEQFDYDRYLIFHIRSRNDLYDEKEYLLSVELMGKYANLILVDGESGRIIDALKKIPPYENTKRTILAGAVFEKTPPQRKSDPYDTLHPDMEESLVKQIQGFSKLLETEIRFRLTSQSYEDILKEIKESASLYLTPKGDSYEFHVIPLTHLQKETRRFSIQEGFDEIYFRDEEKERIRTISDDLFKVVKRQAKHFRSKITKLEESLEEALHPEEERLCGELLFMSGDLDKKGLKEITLEDYEGNPHLIKLDPKYSIKDNANRYFQTYQKKRKGKVYIEEQLDIARKQLTYFDALNEQLSIADYQDALDIREELVRYGYIREKKVRQKKKKKINLYEVRLGDTVIRFGKNNIQNDHLTFDVAKGSDIWFHTKDYHGSHVVVNTDEPSEEIIRICANLAAYYSTGRYSSSVPVCYTAVKNLKKIKGMPAGFVSMKTYKMIYIDPFDDKDLPIRMV